MFPTSAAVAFLTLGGTAFAQQVVSYTADTPLTATNWSEWLSVPQFDPALGTLTQVELEFSGEVVQTMQYENLACVSKTYSGDLETTLTLGRCCCTTLFAPATVELTRSGAVTAFDNKLDYAGTSGFTVSRSTAVSGSLGLSDTLSYVGHGMVSFLAAAITTDCWTWSSACNGLLNDQAWASESVTVVYTYTPIPEPGAFAALLGIAALGLAAWRRRWVGDCRI